MTAATALSLSAILISVVSFLINFWNTRQAEALGRRPVLSFAYGEAGWEILNIGNGPALNVCFSRKRPRGEWFDPVRIPAMAKEGRFSLFWCAHDSSHGFWVTYTDFLGLKYTSYSGDDLTQTEEGWHVKLGPGDEIMAHWKKTAADI